MPKTNRDKLLKHDLYDLLCKMNERAMPHRCVIQLIDGGMRTRCDKYGKPIESCKQCIAEWLNEGISS